MYVLTIWKFIQHIQKERVISRCKLRLKWYKVQKCKQKNVENNYSNALRSNTPYYFS